MRRLGLIAIPFLSFSTPALSADLDGPYYRERDVVIERPAPPRVVERERIVERHYYPSTYYGERRVFSGYYEPRAYGYYGRPYSYNYYDDRPRHYFPRRAFWHRYNDW